ncbi:MAG: MBL fold metallo-hydrolase [Lachnospiraceae bacterium]|nr:MBL fold metallo-hydrolase [Lachnospiraceae bacterium]
MQLTYIHHSGFLLETPACTLLFDFVEGRLPQIPAGKPLYVFVSHTHHDHYTKKVFDVADTAKKQGETEVCFIVSDDVPRRDVPAALKEKTVFLKPHQEWEDGRVHVETLVSNDTGVAFVLAVPAEAAAPAAGDRAAAAAGSSSAARTDDAADGVATHEPSLQIYFAGDLNAWNWDGDEEDMALIKIYHEELARISDRIFDLAFIPLDPRLGEDYSQGITDFFDVCGCEARVIAPMHMWGQYEVTTKARALTNRYPYMDRVLPISREGECFTL